MTIDRHCADCPHLRNFQIMVYMIRSELRADFSIRDLIRHAKILMRQYYDIYDQVDYSGLNIPGSLLSA